jgi:Anti-sigma-K factor rskA/Putative zinc-finger
MSGARDHRRWRADLSAYLLGALEPDESEAMDRHLEDCQRCRDELRWLQPAIDLIPESVVQLEPPSGLRTRLLAEVRSDAVELGTAAEPSAAPGPATAKRRRGLGGFFLRPAVALTAVALAGAVIGGYALRGGGDEAGTTTTATTTIAQGGSVQATLESSGDSGTLQLTGLKQAPSGRIYQAWVQKGNRIEPSSLFDVRRDGTASTAIPHQLQGADMVMVTLEPQGGSKQPSSKPLVSVALPS